MYGNLAQGATVKALLSSTLVDRRTALSVLGAAGLGLFGLGAKPVFTAEADNSTLSTLLPDFSEKSRNKLRAVVTDPGFGGQISVSEARYLQEAEGKSIEAIMLALLPLARSYSRPPISNYRVGVVARGTSGHLYLGANIEFPGHSLGFAVHAEQSALSNAYMHSDQGVAAIALTAAPCGHCRQFMNELSPEGQIEILVNGHPPMKLSSLLPMAFGPADLGMKQGAFPVQQVDLILPSASDELAHAAAEAARRSYAPYTKAHSGVAIATSSGRIYNGAYIENVAFNPSLSPLQTALVSLIAAGEKYSAISRVALMEVEGAVISQRSATEAVLAAIAPAAKRQVLTARAKAQ